MLPKKVPVFHPKHTQSSTCGRKNKQRLGLQRVNVLLLFAAHSRRTPIVLYTNIQEQRTNGHFISSLAILVRLLIRYQISHFLHVCIFYFFLNTAQKLNCSKVPSHSFYIVNETKLKRHNEGFLIFVSMGLSELKRSSPHKSIINAGDVERLAPPLCSICNPDTERLTSIIE